MDHNITIIDIQKGAFGGTVVVRSLLDQTPNEDWMQTFRRATSPAVFGHRVQLDGDQLTVIAAVEEGDVAQMASSEAVALTNALVDDHLHHFVRP